MSLDVSLEQLQPVEVYSRNITHNLGSMAAEAGLYEALWRPEDISAVVAKDLVPFLESGLAILLAEPEIFKKLNPPNGWGTYDGLVNFVDEYLEACKQSPEATIRVCR